MLSCYIYKIYCYFIQPPFAEEKKKEKKKKRCFQFSTAPRSRYHFLRAVPDRDGRSRLSWSPRPAQRLSPGRIIPQLLRYWKSNLQKYPGVMSLAGMICVKCHTLNISLTFRPKHKKTAVSFFAIPQTCFRFELSVCSECSQYTHTHHPITCLSSSRFKNK